MFLKQTNRNASPSVFCVALHLFPLPLGLLRSVPQEWFWFLLHAYHALRKKSWFQHKICIQNTDPVYESPTHPLHLWSFYTCRPLATINYSFGGNDCWSRLQVNIWYELSEPVVEKWHPFSCSTPGSKKYEIKRQCSFFWQISLGKAWAMQLLIMKFQYFH